MAEGLGSRLSSFFGGTPAQKQMTPTFRPEQQQLLDQILGKAQNQLSAKPYQSQFDFAPIESLARKDFQEKTLPSIIGQFRGGDEANSSAFQSALSGAGGDLEAKLAALRSQTGLQQQQLNLQGQGQQNQQLMGLLSSALQPRDYISDNARQPGFGESTLSPLLQTAARAAIAYQTGGASEAGTVLQMLLSLLQGSGEESGQASQGGTTFQPTKGYVPGKYSQYGEVPFL